MLKKPINYSLQGGNWDDANGLYILTQIEKEALRMVKADKNGVRPSFRAVVTNVYRRIEFLRAHYTFQSVVRKLGWLKVLLRQKQQETGKLCELGQMFLRIETVVGSVGTWKSVLTDDSEQSLKTMAKKRPMNANDNVAKKKMKKSNENVEEKGKKESFKP